MSEPTKPTHPFDDRTKTFYRDFFEERGARAVPQYAVFARSRFIDLVVNCEGEAVNALQETIFSHFRRLNSLEFKGPNDPLTTVDFNIIMMRAWGVGAKDLVNQSPEQAEDPDILPDDDSKIEPWLKATEIAEIPHERTITIVSVIRPDKILNDLQDVLHFTPTDEPGIYFTAAWGFPIWLIHPDELDLKPRNYPLLPLARGEKLAQFIDLCLAEGLVHYLHLIRDISLTTDPDLLWQKIMEVLNMTVTISEETWPYIDNFFRQMPEAMQKISIFREALTEREQQALDEGHKAGLDEGHKVGLDEGHKVGLDEGHKVGLDEGHKAGLDEGHKAGLDEGRQALAEMIEQILISRFKTTVRQYDEVLIRFDLPTLKQLSQLALAVDTLAEFSQEVDKLLADENDHLN